MSMEALIEKGRRLELGFQKLAGKLDLGLTLDQRRTLAAMLNHHREIGEVYGLMFQLEQAEDQHDQPCPVSLLGCPKCKD